MSEIETKEQQHESLTTISSSFHRAHKPCRNIALHGYCKYEGQGCEFNHDLARNQLAMMTSSYNYSEILPHSMEQLSVTPTPFSYYIPRAQLPELQYHLYMMPIPSTHKKKSNERWLHDFFIATDLREFLFKKQETMLLQPDPDGKSYDGKREKE
jgi:hypothetical protein